MTSAPLARLVALALLLAAGCAGPSQGARRDPDEERRQFRRALWLEEGGARIDARLDGADRLVAAGRLAEATVLARCAEDELERSWGATPERDAARERVSQIYGAWVSAELRSAAWQGGDAARAAFERLEGLWALAERSPRRAAEDAFWRARKELFRLRLARIQETHRRGLQAAALEELLALRSTASIYRGKFTREGSRTLEKQELLWREIVESLAPLDLTAGAAGERRRLVELHLLSRLLRGGAAGQAADAFLAQAAAPLRQRAKELADRGLVGLAAALTTQAQELEGGRNPYLDELKRRGAQAPARPPPGDPEALADETLRRRAEGELAPAGGWQALATWLGVANESSARALLEPLRLPYDLGAPSPPWPARALPWDGAACPELPAADGRGAPEPEAPPAQ